MEYAHAEINEKKIKRLLYVIVQQSFFVLKCKKMLNREKFLFSKRISFRNIACGQKPDSAV